MTQCLKQFVDYFLKHKDEKLFLNFYVLSSSSIIKLFLHRTLVRLLIPFSNLNRH